MKILVEGYDHTFYEVYVKAEQVVLNKSTGKYCEFVGQELLEDEELVWRDVGR